MKKFFAIFLLALSCFLLNGSAQEEDKNWPRLSNLTPKEELEIFRQAYPWCQFELDYDKEVKDWALKVTAYKKTSVYYRA